jgi:probable F420-dependent oxidoreductase
MEIGLVFPNWSIPSDPIVIRDFAQTMEGLGYDYILTYESLIDKKSDKPPVGWHEPFSLISYIAGCTTKLGFATGITVLPSRQTVLIAKQAAQIDLLTQGRLRFGVAVGESKAEYQAMGIDMNERAQRIDEQITVLRKLWSEPFVSFEGDYHSMENIGIYPRPVQEPIPIWLGGYVDSVLRRIAKMGDGWMMYDETQQTAKEKIAKLHQYIDEAGRKREDVALNIVGIEIGEEQNWKKLISEWAELGVTYFDVSTWKSGFTTWEEHLTALIKFKEAIG